MIASLAWGALVFVVLVVVGGLVGLMGTVEVALAAVLGAAVGVALALRQRSSLRRRAS